MQNKLQWVFKVDDVPVMQVTFEEETNMESSVCWRLSVGVFLFACGKTHSILILCRLPPKK